ncbi:nucleotide sugar dehydrogenase [Parvularcula flava]|uniref:UDP-glucose 6-dehydrogenase n=1 Tax=Aquisalinus luteolus TaxID=1566827 RepID=A0A8J3EQZ0_9PROT|nr:nucleotide sugar dehydrogenase [Aquisalinus luteolus]NHK28038.1 nucleotide sugar dehydrogenase [Aquisalinus luteolus]GGH97277.1 GDP-mannose 6-dehydrogenase [Aquisalinus luteolus]
MKLSIFGLGYVGAVSGACLADLGHQVTGVDLNPDKVARINAGEAPIYEALIGELTGKMVAEGRFSATTDQQAAVRETDLSIISVGTPTAADGSPMMGAVEAVTRMIGDTVRESGKTHTVVVRSTVTPGYCVGTLAPVLEKAAGRKIGDGLHLVFNPEFLREGSSVRDFREPPFTILGSMTSEGAEIAARLYDGIDAPVIRTEPGVAESIKILSNAFHALKISFANEAGRLLKSSGIDATEAMRIFVQDTALNASGAYLRPGFAFGGSCLPKDIRAILSMAAMSRTDLPVLSAVMGSNRAHIDSVLDMIMARIAGGKPRKAALFGLSFKPGTDDLRESPYVALAEKLIGKGFDLSIIDPWVKTSRLLGKNKAFIEQEIPHFEALLNRDLETTLAQNDILIIGHASKDHLAMIGEHAGGKTVIDLANISSLRARDDIDYEGVCW